MHYNRFQEQAHREIDLIFLVLFPKYGMRIREEQTSLCHQMLSALWENKIALCDAAVGVGKTYAYLVACTLFRKYGNMLNGNYCMDGDTRPSVISTSSIALQDALLGEYIPLLSKILVEERVIKRPIRAVLRKGKEHFVCDERLELRLSAVSGKKNIRQKESLEVLKDTCDMDSVSNLKGFDRRMVCVPKRCPADCALRNTCRYQMFLRQAVEDEIDIQICNHNYLLADAAHRANGYRPLLKSYRALIIDEGHKLPETAQQMYEKRLGREDFIEICSLLEQEKYTYTAARLKEEFRRLMASVSQGTDGRCDSRLGRNRSEQEQIPFQMDYRIRRLLKNCIRLLKKAEETTEGETPRWVTNRLGESREVLSLFLSMDRSRILYLEYSQKGGPVLCAAHKRTADCLAKDVWNQGIPALLTSGTLAAGGSFRRIRQMSGLSDSFRVVEYTAPSPFLYQKNVLLYLPKIGRKYSRSVKKDVTDDKRYEKNHKKNTPEQRYIRQTAGQIRELIRATNGHTLVLFTSYSAMGSVYRELRGKTDVPILRVWKDSQRVIREFKAQKNAVLFAAGSCWEGVDFPGDMVSSLILVRLPFPVPDPIRDAEREKYDSLQEYIRKIVVPDMQLKLRQGFGRAIRTETDTCVVSILDGRASAEGRYHKAVLEALPECQMTDKLADVELFIRQRKRIDYYM